MKYNKSYFLNKPKSAIFCNSKHKWDIITREFSLTWRDEDKWSTFKDDTAIIPFTNLYSRKTWYEQNNFEIINFDDVDLGGGSFKTPPVPKQVQISKPVPLGDIVGAKVIKNFPNSDNLTLGDEIYEYGNLSSKWKGENYYKQYPEFFEFIYGYKPIFFGGKEVKITKFNNINCVIECEGKTDDYLHLKELRNALKQISNFSFGGQRLELVTNSAYDYRFNLNKLKFGCTSGTVFELDKIISRCEEILSK